MKIEGILAGIVAFFVAIASAFWGGKKQGEKKERKAQDEQRAKTIVEAKESRDEIEKLAPDEQRRRLDGWMRE